MFDKFGYRTCMLIIGTTVAIVISALPLLTYLGWFRVLAWTADQDVNDNLNHPLHVHLSKVGGICGFLEVY